MQQSNYYAEFNSDGLLKSMWQRAAQVDPESNPPAGHVPLSESDFVDLMTHQASRRWNGETLENYLAPAAQPTGVQVNAERQRRIAVGKVIDGVHVTGSDEDARNLMSLALGAQMRIAAGDTETLTVFRDGDNVDHDLTPMQLLSLWQQSSAYVSALYEASWVLKALDQIPADYAGDSHWPPAPNARGIS